ncbi:MAG: hypothetical protein ACREO9_05915, partial [Lysobacterales bacterium]
DGAALPPGARLQVHLEGNLDTLEVQATLDQPEISLQGRLLRLLTAPQSDLHLSADTLQWPLAGLDPSVTLDAVKAHLTGAPQNYQLDSEATLILQEMPPTHVQVHAKGDLDGMHLDSAQLSSEIAELNASGLLDWSDGFKLKLATTIEQLVPGRWIADWPASQPLQGTVTANWQAEHLELHDMDLKAGDSGFHLGGHLVFDRAEATLNGQLDWASLQWPLDSSQPDFHSAYGQLRLNGRPDDWTAAGTLQLQAGEWPAGVLTLKGKGNQESAALVIEQAEVLGGRIAGQFKTQWTEHQPWSASIHADALDISSLSDAFPGTASVNLSADGQMNPVQVNVDIDDLHGQIRGQPVQAKGGIAFAAGQLRARDLHIVSGSSELQIDGDARTAEGIRIKGNIESLSRFVNDATGSLAVAGLVSLDPDHPLFRLELEGKDLLWRGWRADSITTTSLEDDGGSPGSRIDIKGLGINDRVFESVSLTT